MFARLTKLVAIFLVIASSISAQNSGKKDWSEQNWGLGLAFRCATIPFSTEEKSVMSAVPMIYFENDIFYFQGFEYGIKLYKSDNWLFSFMGRRHFFDAPKDV